MMSIVGWAEVAQLVVVHACVHIQHLRCPRRLHGGGAGCRSPAAVLCKEQMKIYGQEQGTMHDRENEPQNDKISD